jgi:hypothetical protein
MHFQPRGVEARPTSKLEVRNNNVCDVLSRIAGTDTVNLNLSRCGNRPSAERRLPSRLIEAHSAAQRDLAWDRQPPLNTRARNPLTRSFRTCPTGGGTRRRFCSVSSGGTGGAWAGKVWRRRTLPLKENGAAWPTGSFRRPCPHPAEGEIRAPNRVAGYETHCRSRRPIYFAPRSIALLRDGRGQVGQRSRQQPQQEQNDGQMHHQLQEREPNDVARL